MKTAIRAEASPGPFSLAVRNGRATVWLRRLAILLVCLGCGPAAEAGLKIYYLRHGESGANVLNQWKDKPKEQWPAYVGNSDQFSPKGQEQVKAVTQKLKHYHFDFIAVSPAWRTRNTIAPFLKETGLKAEIWSELLEFGSLAHQHEFSELPAPSADLFYGGKAISLSPEEQSLFTVRADAKREFKTGASPAQAVADRLAVVDKDIEMLRKRFGGSDKTLLLVGHGNSGRVLLERLTHDKEAFKTELRNTAMWLVEEQPDGSFRLLMLNDEPWKGPSAPASHPSR